MGPRTGTQLTDADGRYDETSHQYWLRDQRIVGVTELLKATGKIDLTYLARSPDALARGTLVHAATRQYDETGNMEPAPHIIGEMEAYLTFCARLRPVYAAIEQPRFSARYMLGGCPDRILASLGNYGPGVLEIKTGSEAEWHRLQVTGYQLLAPSGGRYVLYLKPNGKYRLVYHTHPSDYKAFYGLLARRPAGTGAMACL
jgi:hypothetical protein